MTAELIYSKISRGKTSTFKVYVVGITGATPMVNQNKNESLNFNSLSIFDEHRNLIKKIMQQKGAIDTHKYLNYNYHWFDQQGYKIELNIVK